MGDWTGRDRVVIDLEGHGREDIIDGVDLSRTVGWFTTMFPVALDLPAPDWATTIMSVKEQLRAVLAHVEELRAKVGRLKAESEGAVAECARLNELFALKWDATQSAETEAARTEVGRLMNAIQRIDGINDYPANYSPGINAVCDEILRPHLKSKP